MAFLLTNPEAECYNTYNDKSKFRGVDMYIPEIPQNSLTDEITQIVELSKKLENEYDFEFDPPLSEVKIILWE